MKMETVPILVQVVSSKIMKLMNVSLALLIVPLVSVVDQTNVKLVLEILIVIPLLLNVSLKNKTVERTSIWLPVIVILELLKLVKIALKDVLLV